MKRTLYRMKVYQPEVEYVTESELTIEELEQYKQIIEPAKKKYLENFPNAELDEQGWLDQWLRDTFASEHLKTEIFDGVGYVEVDVIWVDLDHPIEVEE